MANDMVFMLLSKYASFLLELTIDIELTSAYELTSAFQLTNWI